ncbi:DUF1015 domain-containing protein [bacterium]|nr:DUF1015 domain-containing protein [bacterium]
MAKIIPFRGILYNQKKIKKISQVVTPPYDVISPQEQKKYYRKHKNNIIRIILGKKLPNDNATTQNKYTRAKEYYNNWLEKNVLVRDKKPSIYVYQEEYLFKGKKKKQIGFISLIKLEDFKKKIVIPHEKTLSRPKQDRLKLLQTCKINSSSIFSLYSDSTGQINNILENTSQSPPAISLTGENKIQHKLWKITNPAIINNLCTKMKNKSIFIADGHHRYETALNFRNKMKTKLPFCEKKGTFDYVMMFFSNMENTNLTILPTHRLISFLPKKILTNFEKNLVNNFQIQPFKQKETFFSRLEETKKNDICAFGMYKGDKNTYYLLTLKKNEISNAQSFTHILHELILKKILKLSTKKECEKKLSYTRDANLAIKMVNKKNAQIAFFLPTPSIEEIKNITVTGTTLPQKTTYFYPKLLTGLVINQIRFS